MGYPSDTIDWQIIEFIDAWLDDSVAEKYQTQPLAQDWARVSKVSEELGEAIDALIGITGQNPRKGEYATQEDLLGELADTALTAIYAMQHFTKSTATVRNLLKQKQEYQYQRVMKLQ